MLAMCPPINRTWTIDINRYYGLPIPFKLDGMVTAGNTTMHIDVIIGEGTDLYSVAIKVMGC
jgi:hypothetical protein